MNVKVDLNKVLTSAKRNSRDISLVAIALAISPAITRHESLWIALPVIAIIAVIVSSLVFGPFRRRRRRAKLGGRV